MYFDFFSDMTICCFAFGLATAILVAEVNLLSVAFAMLSYVWLIGYTFLAIQSVKLTEERKKLEERE